MTNVGRYLNNQEIFKHNQTIIYDNSKNGLDDWMLEHLRTFFIHWFDEYNSKPYQKYTIFALNNLASFADNSRVKLAANMLLDLVSAVYAIQSNNGRRLVPFRRVKANNKDRNSLGANSEYGRFAVLAGTFSASRGSDRNGYLFESLEENREWYDYHVSYASDAASLAAVHSYRVPPMILDLMIRKDHNTHFQTLRHFGQELYFSSKSYLISGGGIYADDSLFGSVDIGLGHHGWATPTMIIATQDPSNNARSWIRIEGHTSLSKKINHSIYRNFATGSNLFIPGYIPYSCRKVVDGTHWKFFDFASAECPFQYGFYVAVYQEPCGRSLPQKSRVCISNGANWGFWETREGELRI